MVAFTLTLIISMVILVALYRLRWAYSRNWSSGPGIRSSMGCSNGLWRDHDPPDRPGVQSHPAYVVNRAQSIIQTKVVLLIALLAVARKVIIVDLKAWG